MARQKVEDPFERYFTKSKIFRAWSYLALPLTLPLDFTCNATKRYEKCNFKFNFVFMSTHVGMFEYGVQLKCTILGED